MQFSCHQRTGRGIITYFYKNVYSVLSNYFYWQSEIDDQDTGLEMTLPEDQEVGGKLISE